MQFRWDDWSCVGHIEKDGVTLLADGQRDRTLVSKPVGIVEQFLQNQLQALVVGMDHLCIGHKGLEEQLYLAGIIQTGGGYSFPADGIAAEGRHVEVGHLSSIGGGSSSHHRGDALDGGGIVLHPSGDVIQLLFRDLFEVDGNHLRKAVDDIQRCTNLVGHVLHKDHLSLISLTHQSVCLLQFLVLLLGL